MRDKRFCKEFKRKIFCWLFVNTFNAIMQNPFTCGGFPQNDALFHNCLAWAFAAAALSAEWLFIAAYQFRPVRRGLSAAMKINKKNTAAFTVK